MTKKRAPKAIEPSDDEEEEVEEIPSPSSKSGRSSSGSVTFDAPSPAKHVPKRKSTVPPSLGDDLEMNDDLQEKRTNQRKRDKRKSMGLGFLATTTRRTSAQTGRGIANSARTLTSTELEDLFHNCIKLSTENKINSKNTWQLNLIDYIGEVIETNINDGSNFQVASCTLDASVKIYSTRVDSVHSETYKVLTSFSRADTSKKAQDPSEEELNRGDKEGEDEKTKKKRLRHGVNTLETNINNLTVKKIDLTYTIEPLYHTSLGSSNNFDVGSASSLLLNNLGLGSGCEVIIDAKSWNYALNKVHEVVHRPEIEQKPTTTTDEEPEEVINMDKTTMGHLLSPAFVERGDEEMVDDPPHQLDSTDIAPPPVISDTVTDGHITEETTTMHEHAGDDFMEFGGLGGDAEMDLPMTESLFLPSTQEFNKDMPQRLSIGGEAANALLSVATDVGGLAPDYFANANDDDNDDEDVMGLFDNDFAQTETRPETEDEEIHLLDDEKEKPEETAPTSVVELLQKNPEAISLDNEYGYFDIGQIKHWAGVDHWKLSRTKSSSSVGKKSTKKRTTKETVLFDFYTDLDNIDFKNDFKYLKKEEDNQMSEKTISSQKSTLLPEDIHYDINMLLKPFNLPPFNINKSFTNKSMMITEADAQKYNQAPQKNQTKPIQMSGGMQVTTTSKLYDESDDDDLGNNMDGNMMEVGGLGGFDDFLGNITVSNVPASLLEPSVGDPTHPGISDQTMTTHELSDASLQGMDETIEVKQAELNNVTEATAVGGVQLIEAPKQVEKLNIKYATRAKQVDVRALKEQLWSDIQTTSESKMDFSQMVSSLNTTKPKSTDKKPDFSEVSVPFCFICMLHICNEQGLELEGTKDFSDFAIVKPSTTGKKNAKRVSFNDEE